MAECDSGTSGLVREALSRPESCPVDRGTVEVRETHISWVFLVGDLAYKLKKPVVLEFVDYGSAARRREMCDAEVRLNRRLAPDIYLGVRGVAATDAGLEFTAEDDPRALDYVVEMRRYDERDTLAARVDTGELDRTQVTAVGQTLARFHAGAPAVAAGNAPVLAVERRFERNLHELLACVEQRGEVERIHALERFGHSFIVGHAHTFQARAGSGRVREGHGDLRAEHILVNGQVRIVDCVEFDPDLREIDVADDLAFLVFDLVARGKEPFAELLVRAYRNAGGDPGGDSLIAFYGVQRALVRAKVDLVRAAQFPPTSAARGHKSARARELIVVAERFAWRARLPLVIVVCGVPASGKSYLARRLTELSGLAHLSSDRVRKRLRGLRATQRAGHETYSVEWNERTYAELGRLAEDEVRRRRGAIVDATFRHLSDRDAFASAFGAVAPLLFVECQAPRPVLAERAAHRDHDPERESDADLAIVIREQEAWEPLDELRASAHVALRTDRPMDEIVGDLLALLDRRLLAGVG